MTETLKKKFIMTSMTAITILLLLLIGSINIANLVASQRRIERDLEVISDRDEAFGRDESTLPPMDFMDMESEFMAKNAYDTFMASNFFVVRIDNIGSATFIDISRTSKVTNEEAITMAAEACKEGEMSGTAGSFRYKINPSLDGSISIVFLDTSAETSNCIFILIASLGIGVFFWILMLVLVIFLSGRAIKPIAENIEKQKQFVTNAGHEIKTPLAIIRSNTEAMELIRGKDKYSKNIKDQTERLAVLMNNLLTLSKMDEGTLKFKFSPTDVTELAESVAKPFLQPMEMRNITFSKDTQPGVTADLDKQQAELLMSILFDNAVKYTNEGGSIELKVKKEGKHAVIKLTNTVDEIPEAKPDRLFERFYRADQSHTQKTGGSGIGLSVAKSVAEALKGNIEAKYEDGKKISFTVTF